MEIKKDMWVLISEKSDIIRYGSYAKITQKLQCPLLVYAIELDKVYCKTVGMFYNWFLPNAFYIAENYLIQISEDEAKKRMEKLNIINEKEAKEKLKQLETKHIKIKNRVDYDLSDKSLLSTIANYCKLFYKLTPKERCNSNEQSRKYGGQCCDFSKTSDYNIMMYISQSWLTYFGYNANNLQNYIDFLKGCNIGFDAEIIDIVDLHKEFNEKPSKLNAFIRQKEDNYFLKEDEQAYRIFIPCSNYNMITYLYFICLRYIYNSRYWNIPWIAMKLKANMPEISNWECLLLAHNTNEYYHEYALTKVSNANKLLITKDANTQEIVLNNLKSNKLSMNNSFKVYDIPENIGKLIRDENYEELQKIIKKYKE